jgi:general secretion pathway protein N
MAVARVIWPLGILLVIFCALTASAMGGPSKPRRPGLEGTSAPAREGTDRVDAPGSSRVPRELDSGSRSRAGNPLWTVPLSALPATRDRPLFSVSRRPPFITPPIADHPPKQEALAPPALERPSLTLIGTIVSREASVAILQGSNAESISRLGIGQENEGWRVRGIGVGSIVVEKGAQSVQLRLPRLDGGREE